MARLLWNQAVQKKYESGLDRGVLFLPDSPGIVWNGLISVDESFVGGETSEYHFDGIKYLDVVGSKTYQANITSFAPPLRFSEALGERPVIPGFVLTRQPRSRFGFSYRSMIGDSGDYKIHIIYNALATPTSATHKTMSESVEAQTYSWKIDAVPPRSEQYRPSAHFILNSTTLDPDALVAVETMLYGSNTETSYLPTIDELFDAIAVWAPLFIIPQELTGLAELTSGGSDLYMTRVPGILRRLPNTRLNKSTISGLYRME